MSIILALLNLGVVALMCAFSWRKNSFSLLVWGLAGYFAVAGVYFSAVSELTYDVGYRPISISSSGVNIAILFMLLFNTLMALSSIACSLILPVQPWKQDRQFLFDAKNYSDLLLPLLYVLIIFQFVFGFLYVFRVSEYQHFQDRYLDGRANWSMVLYVATWSSVTIAFVLNRWFLLSASICLSLLVIYMSGVRYYSLFFILPVIVMIAHKRSVRELEVPPRLSSGAATPLRSSSRYIRLLLLVGMLIAVVAGAVFVRKLRAGAEGSAQLPEFGLYVAYAAIVDHMKDVPQDGLFGWHTATRAIAAIGYPVTRYTGSIDYYDVPHYFGEYLLGLQRGSIAEHFPALIYGDAFASFGMLGCMAGAVWGVLYSFWDRLLTHRPIFIAFFPYFVWFVYMTYRGAVSNSILSIPREIYINVLLAGAIYGLLKFSTSSSTIKAKLQRGGRHAR